METCLVPSDQRYLDSLAMPTRETELATLNIPEGSAVDEPASRSIDCFQLIKEKKNRPISSGIYINWLLMRSQ